MAEKFNGNALADIAYRRLYSLVNTDMIGCQVEITDVQELEICSKILRCVVERKKRVVLDVNYDHE